MSPPRSPDELARDLAELASAPDPDEAAPGVLSVMEEWIARRDGAAELVNRYASSEQPVVTRVLGFLLARAASTRQLGVPAGPLIVRAVERLRADDDWTRVNLLSALQLSSMHGELLASGEAPPSVLMSFLLDCAARGEQVQSALVGGAIPELRASGVLARAPRADVDALRARLRAIQPKAGSLLEMELGELAPFLAEE